MRHWTRLGIVAGALGLLAATTGGPVAAAADPAVAITDHGPVRGAVNGQTRGFTGIPYAAPPTKELGLRWKPPQPAAAWTEIRDATKAGSSCPQPSGFPMTEQSTSEDCLYLNVTTPINTAGKRLPVMVWLHGGGLAFGAGDLFGGQSLAAKGDVVVVTVNYRLGALGFLDHPALDGRAGEALSGNFGLQDQQAALRWVQRNAAAFGGDPHNVTLFGESAGSISTCAHLAAPGSAGLFQRAISQSAPCALRLSPTMYSAPRPRAVAEQQGKDLAVQLKCDDPAHPKAPPEVANCLLGLDTSAFASLPGYFGAFGLGPVIGGPVLPQAPAQAITEGRFNKVPVLTGITRDEERFMVNGLLMQGGHLATEQDYRTQLAANFCAPAKTSCATADAVAARYPAGDYTGSYPLALSAALTDSVFAHSALDTDRLLAKQVPTYAYEFADEQAPGLVGPQPQFPQGAYHTAELGYLFSVDWNTARTPAQDQLADQMISYWTQFARTGNPNGPTTPCWPRFRGGEYVQALAPGDGGIHPVNLAKEHNDEFWRNQLLHRSYGE